MLAECRDFFALAVAQDAACSTDDILDGVAAVKHGHDESPQFVCHNPGWQQWVDKHIFITPLEDLYLFGKSVSHRFYRDWPPQS